ncbi:MAG: DUF4835 family protein [Saprospiraceae bacterium]|nr:DUF4835 family protein [Saprospiraceae bacterium]
MKNIVFILFIITLSNAAWSQELDFQVTINTPKLQTADPKVFETLELSIREFLNNTQWTSDSYEPEERIKGNIIININEERSATNFTAEVLIQSARPIYGSTQETRLITLQDKNVWFDYEQYQPLIYSQNNFNDNLTSILAFYAYIVLGMDYDSFSPFGGQPHYLKAQEILNNVPSNVSNRDPQGWTATGGNRNRYWIIENILSPRVRPLRQAMYDYHRQGLDLMASDVVASVVVIADALNSLGEVQRAYPNAMILQMFSDAKTDEIIEILLMLQQQKKIKSLK